MLTRTLALAACCGTLAALPAPSVRADATADAHRVIQAELDAMMSAATHGNYLAEFDYYAPDYGHDGTSLTSLKKQFAAIQARLHQDGIKSILSGRVTIRTLTLQGDQATVTTLHDTRLTVFIPGHLPSTKATKATGKAVWKKYGGKWLIAQSDDPLSF